ncbi:hypothetical protein DV738_g1152, partial [Chaetothyriales sp. CBS 135597]
MAATPPKSPSKVEDSSFRKTTTLFHHSLITSDFDALTFSAAAALQLKVPALSDEEQGLHDHITSKSDHRLIVSPYNSSLHLLDLERYDHATRLLAKALTILKPIRDGYATEPFLESFNFGEVFSLLRKLVRIEGHCWQQQEFYVVTFRSQLKPNADSNRLFDLDSYSHAEAMASGGLLKYWYGVKDENLKNLATCFWRSRKDAYEGGKGPWHAQARAAAGIWYQSIVFKTFTLTIEDDAPEPPLKAFTPPKDRAFFADPKKTSLLSAAKAVKDLTPFVGTELEGIQLSQLTDAQKDELALLVAERGVVTFRQQDLTLEQQYALSDYWGIRDRDPNQVDPRHVTVLGRNDDVRVLESYGGDYHGDHSFEVNPPSYTILRFVRHPPTGGDTLFTSQAKLYDSLSPTLKKTLSGLTAVHSSEQAYALSVAQGGKPLRGPVRTEHPLIRTHPVTRKQLINYNPQFVIHIPALTGVESKHVMEFLREHLHTADDFTVRWKWEPNSIAIWDNRSVAHRAIPGGYDPRAREATRTAVFGEVPFYEGPSQNEPQVDAKEKQEEIFDGYFGRYDEGKEGEITEGVTASTTAKAQPSAAEIVVN